MPLSPGTRLGPYEIGVLIGAGGMGEVYRARDTRLDRTVAIKVLPPDLSADVGLRERFEREARAVAALNHPHICVLHDVGHQDGLDFIVMEHIAGETLADRLAKGPLPLDHVLQFGMQIADALDRAHREGIVHRDLKPGNIMITGTGAGARVKLLDFGLAKLKAPAVAALGPSQAATVERDLTGHGAILGTLRYMAPEQLEGLEADARSDIFALGAVLYEMATGRRAFDGASQVSVIAAIMEHEPAPLSSIQPLTPLALEHVVSGCLAKSPDDRWQTARDVGKQLKWVASGATASVAATQAAPPRRRWLAWAAAGGALAVAVIAGVIAFDRLSDSDAAPQVMRFEVATPPVSNPFLLLTTVVSPDGRSLVFVAPEATTSTPVLYVRPLDAVDVQKLPGTEGAANPFWSPDSRSIGFGAQGRLKRIDVAGGPPQTITDLPAGLNNFAGGTWNADGVIVFGGQGPLRRVNASGGQTTEITTLDAASGEVGHIWPTFLPDGRHVLFLAARPGGLPRQIRAAVLDSSDTTEVMSVNSNPVYAPSGHLLFHRDGTLMAQRFDPSSLTLSGEPLRVADGVAFNPGSGRGAFSVSDTGVLTLRHGTAFEPTRLTWFDRRGASGGSVGDTKVYRGLDLSPDDERLAVHVHQEPTGGDLWVIDLRRGNETRFTFMGHNFAPSWSRDGKYVMFSSDKEGPGLNLYRKPAGGATGDEMMLGSGGAAFVEDLTPDGEWMVYGAGNIKTGIDVMRVPLTRKGDPEPVVSSQFFDGLAKISPNGKWIAYESDESTRREIYAQAYPKATTKWQISVDGGRYVRWSPKGDEIFFLTDEGVLMAAAVREEGAALVPSKPTVLFKANPLLANHRGSALDLPYDVTSDGQRFIVNERLNAGVTQSPINVILNWTSLLAK